jgi:anti-sigma factor RsiW
MALNLVPFGRWTLRDKAAHRRLALRLQQRGADRLKHVAEAYGGGTVPARALRHLRGEVFLPLAPAPSVQARLYQWL